METARIPYIYGQRVEIFPTTEQDIPYIYQLWTDINILRNFNYKPNWRSYEDFVKWFRKRRGPHHAHLDASIFRRIDREFIGVIGIGIFTRHKMSKKTDVALIICEKYRNQGYGRESLALSIRYAFENLEIQAITAGVYEHNLAMQHLFDSLGFNRTPLKDLLIKNVFSKKYILQMTYILPKLRLAF